MNFNRLAVALSVFSLASCAFYSRAPHDELAVASMATGGREVEHDTESYSRIDDNPFLAARESPLSTFSIDVDTAAYSNVRRFVENGTKPPRDAVRIEELINYFPYAYAPPADGRPFAVNAETFSCPWAPSHRLVRLGIKGREVSMAQRPRANLVFLIDVSGSMSAQNKLGLLKPALRMLAENLRADDTVALAVYAGSSGLALPPTRGDERSKIFAAIDALEAGGSTNGAAGIELAYETAKAGFVEGGINRVILATDGDFNVGVSSEGELTRLIEEKAKTGVFLTVLGFGMGNYKDSTLEKLADTGNGNYGYIDTLSEARKVLVEQAAGTLLTIAKDVKLQVEFNPAKVSAYRLIGYENRVLRSQDFNDDEKDAGDLGAGHTVTALYEVVPVGVGVELPSVDALKYVKPAPMRGESEELCTVKLRYKEPAGSTSQLLSFPITDSGKSIAQANADARFQAAVAELGLLLRGSPHKGSASWAEVIELASASAGNDKYRAELVELAKRASKL
ncbi:MAG: VWA domain-containing protein [Myxococcaceae bacterium]|nr:VWA domain-containing protein [Myxococcaceae bacterium]